MSKKWNRQVIRIRSGRSISLRFNREGTLVEPSPGRGEPVLPSASARVRSGVLAIRWNEELENTAPEGRTNLAQRFQRWGKAEMS